MEKLEAFDQFEFLGRDPRAGVAGHVVEFRPGLERFRQTKAARDGFDDQRVQFADNNYQRSENKSLLIAAGNRADLLVMAPKTSGVIASTETPRRASGLVMI